MSTRTNTPAKTVVAGLAAAAIALGGYFVGHSNSNSSASAAVPQTAAAGQLPGAGQGRPGFGTVATGTAADKAKAAALAKYSGTVQTVMKLSDGSYVVHVVTSNGEVHVLVSKDFKVTGTQQGPPAGVAPGGAAAPSAAGAASS
jgi:hypothetical protein